MKKVVFITTVLLISMASLVFSAEKRYYGADYIYEVNEIAVFWAVLKGNSIDSNLVYVNIVPLKPDALKYQHYSVVASNVFSGEKKVRVEYENLKMKNIIKVPYAEFLSFSEVSILLFEKSDFKTDPRIVIYYKGVPDAAPEFKEEYQINAFFKHSIDRLTANK